MNHSPRIASTLRMTLLAALLAAGGVQAQTGSAAEASSTPSSKSSSTAPAASGGSTSGSKGAATAMSRGDQKMLEHLAQANMAEIKTGELALKKSQNAEVKQFAQKMVDEHGAALKEVQQLADAKGMKMPNDVDTKHKAAAAAMEKLDGDKFDKAYMKQGGVSDHKNTHKLVQDIQAKAKDTDLKALAAKLQPTIDQHLQMAQGIKEKKADSKSGSSQAGSSGSGNK
jgi:putative membrane protein